jgi:hypothetical protein
MVRARRDPTKVIKLSKKTGIPLGVLKNEAPPAVAEADEHEERDDEDEDDDDGAVDLAAAAGLAGEPGPRSLVVTLMR